ncbi:MAG TPA: AraC family ligand binding domain-containing protein, partial [Phototrophicaceae bacterium]|nr:AraC family ligand binding domain-containing protein [Phototrophicaceae bacterium]
MNANSVFYLPIVCPITAQNAGLFISRGKGPHPTRVIDSHEIIFIKQGQLDMWEENCTFQVKAGQTLHLWPGRQHGGLTPMAANLKFYWIHFQPEIGPHSGDEPDEITTRLEIPQVVTITYPEKLESLF